MAAAIPGMGMKTVSFALHIYAPFQCLILTVDRHHLKRLGYAQKSPTPNQYLQAEQKLFALIAQEFASEQGYAPIVYAACLWENWRQETGVSKETDCYQSHAKLAPFSSDCFA